MAAAVEMSDVHSENEAVSFQVTSMIESFMDRGEFLIVCALKAFVT